MLDQRISAHYIRLLISSKTNTSGANLLDKPFGLTCSFFWRLFLFLEQCMADKRAAQSLRKQTAVAAVLALGTLVVTTRAAAAEQSKRYGNRKRYGFKNRLLPKSRIRRQAAVLPKSMSFTHANASVMQTIRTPTVVPSVMQRVRTPKASPETRL